MHRKQLSQGCSGMHVSREAKGNDAGNICVLLSEKL